MKTLLILLTIFALNLLTNNLKANNWVQVPEIGEDVYVHSIFYPKNDASKVIVIADSIPIDRSAKSLFPSFFALLEGYGYFESNDGGSTFPNQNLMNNYIILSINESKDNENIWVCSAIERNISRIGFSTDKGATWDFASSECTTTSKILSFVNLPDKMLAGAVSTGFGLISSSDNFNNCQRNDTLNVSVRDIRLLGNRLYLASDDNAKTGAYFSSNLGDTWQKDAQGLNGLRINTICPSPAYQVFNYVLCGADRIFGDSYQGAGIYASSDNGSTWRLQGANNSRVYDIKYHPRFPLFMVAACGTNGVFISSNGGVSWTQYNSGLPEDFDVRFVSIPDKNISSNGYEIYLGVFGKGLWRAVGIQPELVSVENSNEIERISVGPNPFNSMLDIYFNSEKAENVNVSIIDLRGETLFENNYFLNLGVNNINLNNLDFSTGLYFLSIQTSYGIFTSKIIKK